MEGKTAHPTTRVLFETVSERPEPQQAEVQGEIPKWVKGTLLKNGPGIFNVGNDQYNHWFDGLAIMQRYFIEDGKVECNTRYLRSDTYNANINSNRIIVSEFGTSAFPDPCKSLFQRYFSYYFPGEFTDNDLVNFIQCGDQVFASSETGMLNRIDVDTLERLEKVDMHKYVAINIATAHPHYDSNGDTLNMASSYTAYNIVRVPKPDRNSDDNAFKNSRIVASIPASTVNLSYYHSFGMAENWVVLPEMPLHVNSWRMMTASFTRMPFCEGMFWDPKEETVFHVVNLKTGEKPERKYTADGFFTFHHANAFEMDGCLVVDTCAYPDGKIVSQLNLEQLRNGEFNFNPETPDSPQGNLWRFVIPLDVPKDAKIGENLLESRDLKTKARAELRPDGSIYCQHEIIGDKFFEFPRINYEMVNGKPYRYLYGINIKKGAFRQDQVLKIDVTTGNSLEWDTEHEHQFVGEAVFVARPGADAEDDGVLVAPVTDIREGAKHFLLVLDARDLKELGRALVDFFIPIGFHAHFLDQKDN